MQYALILGLLACFVSLCSAQNNPPAATPIPLGSEYRDKVDFAVWYGDKGCSGTPPYYVSLRKVESWQSCNLLQEGFPAPNSNKTIVAYTHRCAADGSKYRLTLFTDESCYNIGVVLEGKEQDCRQGDQGGLRINYKLCCNADCELNVATAASTNQPKKAVTYVEKTNAAPEVFRMAALGMQYFLLLLPAFVWLSRAF